MEGGQLCETGWYSRAVFLDLCLPLLLCLLLWNGNNDQKGFSPRRYHFLPRRRCPLWPLLHWLRALSALSLQASVLLTLLLLPASLSHGLSLCDGTCAAILPPLGLYLFFFKNHWNTLCPFNQIQGYTVYNVRSHNAYMIIENFRGTDPREVSRTVAGCSKHTVLVGLRIISNN